MDETKTYKRDMESVLKITKQCTKNKKESVRYVRSTQQMSSQKDLKGLNYVLIIVTTQGKYEDSCVKTATQGLENLMMILKCCEKL